MNGHEAILVVDLGYGDCGKGTIVDFLTRYRSADLVVRFNGGPQAAHNVVTPDGRHHTFAQFGAGSFVPGVRTLLSRFVLVEPYALLNEAAHLASVGVPDAMRRLVIDGRCAVITPFHQAANRLRELARGAAAHGTCGMGVGETMSDLADDPTAGLFARDLRDRARVLVEFERIRARKLMQLRDAIDKLQDVPAARRDVETLMEPRWIDTAVEVYASVVRRGAVIDEGDTATLVREDAASLVFEGAQGVLLDEWRGFHPYTTWSTTTFENADAVLDEAGFDGRRVRVGVLRTYATRHGPGPFPTERADLRVALPEHHNGDAGAQGRFRVGTFDAVASRYALAAAGGVDVLAVTHLDRLAGLPRTMCTGYLTVEGHLRDIPLGPPRDLKYQERMTATVNACQPVHCDSAWGDADEFVDTVEQELGYPVGMTSAGATADDKRVVTPAAFEGRAGVGAGVGRP